MSRSRNPWTGVAWSLLACALLMAAPCLAKVWYFDDGHPANIWGTTDQYQSFSHVEGMSEGCLSSGTFAFMDPDSNYVAITDELVNDYFGYAFQGLIFMHNTSSNQSYPVVSTLWVSQGGQTSWHPVGTDTVNVTHDGNPPPLSGPMYHHFDYGICNYHTQYEKLEVVIDYVTSSSNTATTYIYWDGLYTYSSSLHALSPGSAADGVVCEHSSGTHPAHPDTYWYDVTPAATRKDFHVRVYDDADPSDYSGWIEPQGWAHSVHSAGNCANWVSWYAPTSAESLMALTTYRFGFVNDNPRTWGDWTTTTGGGTKPYASVADSSGAHAVGQDGYGTRVHVPKKEQSGGMPAITPLQDGYFEGDAVFDDIDGTIVLAICGETDGGAQTAIYEWDGEDFTVLQYLDGITSQGSGCLGWADYDLDGDSDLAIAGTMGSGRIAHVYRNDDGAFVLADVLTGLSNASVAWADYDGDGYPELLTMGHDGTSRRAIIYNNNGYVPFEVGEELVGLNSGSADWGDFNGDELPDLVTTGNDGTARVTIFYLNDPPGVLTPVGDLGLPGIALSDTEWADYDRDGDLDLAFTGETSSSERMARVYRNDGSMVFTQVADVLSIYRSSCAWGDYNMDGDLDVAFCGYTGTSLVTHLYRNTGSGFEDSGLYFPGVREGALCFCDLDGDCDPDFFMCGADWLTKYGQPYENTGIDWVGVPETPEWWSSRRALIASSYPNPFNPTTTVRFTVPVDGRVELAIHDLSGRCVRTLVNAPMEPGDYELVWDGTDLDGRQVASGVYFCRLATAAGTDEKKMVLVK